jgi:hypothetical protein
MHLSFLQFLHEPCKHIAAALLKYIDEANASIIGNGIHRPVKHTDSSMQKLLAHYIPLQSNVSLSGSSPVILEPLIHSIHSNIMEVSFKIYTGTGHKYTIQNLDEFCNNIANHATKRYGKTLEFVHSLQAFSLRSRPMIQFLMGLSAHEDSYTAVINGFSGYYAAFTAAPLRRVLTLKGRYLDEFFASLQDLNAYINIPNSYNAENEVLLNVVDGTPDMHAQITPVENGYLFKGSALQHALGHSYIYFLDYLHKRIIRTPLSSDEILPLLNFLDENPNEDTFIDQKDLPAFAKYVYPLVKRTYAC